MTGREAMAIWAASVQVELARRQAILASWQASDEPASQAEYEWATMTGSCSRDGDYLYTVQPDGSILQERFI